MDFLKRMYVLAKKRADELGSIDVDITIPCRPFKAVLRDMAVIAEVKYATPAEGNLGLTERPSELARGYESLGASAVSCLTEPAFFAGNLAYLSEIRQACSLPVLMKDFIVDERQILEGRRQGADAVLLITEMLSREELTRLFHFARGLGMSCLVEVHGPAGLEKAAGIDADVIGVNVRDMSTLLVVPERHEEMMGLLPKGAAKVAESGISSKKRLQELSNMGYDAALVGRAMARKDTREGLFACG